MAYRLIVLSCIQALCLQNAYSSCIPTTVTETCVQNPVLVNPPIVAQPGCVASISPCEFDFISQYAVPTIPAIPAIPSIPAVPSSTIIQDGSVANNLANALQLLIVSNLLSNTLPTTDFLNLGVPIAQPALSFAQPALSIAQPALSFAQPALSIAQPSLLAPPILPFGCGCGCGCGCGSGCGCGCGGLNYIF